jgi:hypothetical protein
MHAERRETVGATFRLTLPAAPREALADG